ncbi:DIP1984 family protein [Picosynechococcus sp. NKBG15041c]|uniref:DIP1984 family protein n=1 Tax=Picosynechococcus sp. NKBG15041c TaxID=1407650 RepID=UPI0004141F44|nr:DIP1984 family protein [Picosynechococcus sp. NKBG15041c]
MKLAEALILRADGQTKVTQLRQRLVKIAKVQEGEEPPENPQELLQELDEVFTQVELLIQCINRTNSQADFGDGLTLSDALAKRDVMAMRYKAFNALVESACDLQDRYSRTEIKMCSTVNVVKLQKKLDYLAKQYREFDTKIQSMNWQVDLLE